MPKKKAGKQLAKARLFIVKTEMAKPRAVESSKKNADTLANGGRVAAISGQTLRTKLPV